MLKVALTHDVDRTFKSYQYFTKSIRSLASFELMGIKNQIKSLTIPNPYWTFDQIMNMESKYGIRSTFFFLNESIKVNILKPKTFKLSLGRYSFNSTKIKSIIQLLNNEGWEIGLHGSFNSYKNIDLLREEKKELEDILSKNIIGIRQHYLNLDHNSWYIQELVGFKYDSSFGHTQKIGFKDNVIKPFHPLNNQFTVFPLQIMDTCFMLDENRWSKFDLIVQKCYENDGILVINFHPHVFHDYDFPGYTQAYEKIILKIKEYGGIFLTLDEAYKQFNNVRF